MSRTIGIFLIIVGVILGSVAAAYLFTNPDLSTPARILGFGLAILVLIAPLVGGGIYLARQGANEAKQMAVASQQRKLLNIVQSKGTVQIADVAVELQTSVDKVKDAIYELVGLGVYSGYINWEKGALYSSEASKLRELKSCPNCGGEITLSGKGVAHCRFCGTEFFLS